MANHKLFLDSGFLAETEGGVSRAPASIDPYAIHAAPNSNGAHTNRGVTWVTYKAYCKMIGIQATTEAFLSLSHETVADIFKRMYWNVVQGDTIDSQAIAEYFAHFVWGSGYGQTPASTYPLQAILIQNGKKIAHDGLIGGETIRALNELLKEKPRLEKPIYDAIHDGRQKALRGFYNYAQNPGWRSSQNKLYALGLSRISTLTAVEREAKAKVDATFNFNNWRIDYATELAKAVKELTPKTA